MLLMIDAMAQRYGMLPSELLCKADTFDVLVMDTSLRYQKKMSNKQKGIVDQSDYNQQELMDRMQRARNK